MSQTTKPAKRGRRTVARHGELKSPHPLALILKIVGIVVAVVLVSSAGVAAYAAYDITASFTEDAVDLEGQEAVPPDIGAIEGGVNLARAGTDECEPEYAAYFGDRCTGADAGGRAQRRQHARAHLRAPAPRHGRLVPARPDDPDPVVHARGRLRDVGDVSKQQINYACTATAACPASPRPSRSSAA